MKLIKGVEDPVLGTQNYGDSNRRQEMHPASVMIKLILIIVWRNLLGNPNT